MFEAAAYIMKPHEEFILLGGHGLLEGMIVIMESGSLRATIDIYTGLPIVASKELGDVVRKRALQYNRWCTVTQLRITNDRVTFVGVYNKYAAIGEAEYQAVFDLPLSDSWFVKTDSYPEEPQTKTNLYNLGYQTGRASAMFADKENHEKELQARYNQGFVDGHNAKTLSQSSTPFPPEWPRLDSQPEGHYGHYTPAITDAQALQSMIEKEGRAGFKPVSVVFKEGSDIHTHQKTVDAFRNPNEESRYLKIVGTDDIKE